jgi:hypothetical protein
MTLGCHAFVADGPDGLAVITVAGSYGPEEIGSHSFGTYARGITVAGDHAYIASRDNGLVVVDVSDPLNPAYAGAYKTAGGPKAVAVAADYAYVADGPTGLVVADIADPTNPAQVAVVATGDPTYDVALAGDCAFVANSYSGLAVIDISDPLAPVVIGSHDTEGISVGIAVAGDYAFVADRDSGLMVFDVSVPSAPAAVGSCDTQGFARGVAVQGDYAYVADGANGLVVIDILDPTNPSIVGSVNIGYGAFDLFVYGDYAYVVDSYSGLVVIDISNPAAPLEMASIVPEGTARDVVVAGDLAYVSLDNTGFKIFSVLDRFVAGESAAGQSLALPVVSPPDTVREVRVATVQSDSVTWEVSADSTLWQALGAGSWVELDQPGTSLYWRSEHRYVSYRVNPTVTLLELEWPDPEPVIETVTDVPDDQGGWVDVRFHRSAYDFAAEPAPIAYYDVWRLTGSGSLRGDSSQWRRTASVSSGAGDFPPGEWAFAGRTTAARQSEYVVAVQTLADSGVVYPYHTVFVVSAHTADSVVYWVSPPDSGWSVDNLPPAVPTGLVLTDSLFSWDPCPDPDFHHFSVYGSHTGDFGTAEWIDDTATPLIEIYSLGYAWYHVTASDSTGNESGDAAADTATVSVDDPLGGPALYFLAPGRPNPFKASTEISFSLAIGGMVRVAVFDVNGYLVATLLEDELPPGRHGVVWSVEEGRSPGVGPGVYFVTVRSGAFTATRKLVHIR